MISLPSMDALMAGKRFKASIEAFTKNDIKPSLAACFCSNRVLYWLRRSMTFCILTSLKVVNIAAFCWACNSRSATFALRRVIATRCSGRRFDVTGVGSIGRDAIFCVTTVAVCVATAVFCFFTGAGVCLLR